MSGEISNVIVVSDLHCGCQVGLCPPRVTLDSGGVWTHGPTQAAIWAHWEEMWGTWVPKATRGEPFAVVVNGDAMDGHHHRSKTQITQNFSDQEQIAYEVLAPIVDRCNGRFWMVRGTEAHVGQCAENEERLARRLGAVKNELGMSSGYELRLNIGNGVAHFTHHIGTTSRVAYETSALMGELAEMLVDAGLTGRRPPDVVVRSHRHRHIEIRKPSNSSRGVVFSTVFTTSGWQGRTPYVYKVARIGDVQVGGSLIRAGDEELYTRHFTRYLPQTPVVDVTEVPDADGI